MGEHRSSNATSMTGVPADHISVSTTLETTDKPDAFRLATRVEVIP